MPINLLKRYNELLDIRGLSYLERKKSLHGVFERDFMSETNLRFNNKEILPIFKDGIDSMEVLFHHLTTTMVDQNTRKREIDLDRSERLHWVVHHFNKHKELKLSIFSSRDKDGIRTYIYNDIEKYVIVLEPYRNKDKYYLLSAYHLTGRNKNKIKSKQKRKLSEVL